MEAIIRTTELTADGLTHGLNYITKIILVNQKSTYLSWSSKEKKVIGASR